MNHENRIYPDNYRFWNQDEHYDATLNTLQKWNPEVPVTVIGHEEIITSYHGYNVPEGFYLIRYADGSIGSVHESRLK